MPKETTIVLRIDELEDRIRRHLGPAIRAAVDLADTVKAVLDAAREDEDAGAARRIIDHSSGAAVRPRAGGAVLLLREEVSRVEDALEQFTAAAGDPLSDETKLEAHLADPDPDDELDELGAER